MRVQPGQLPDQPGSEGRVAWEQSGVAKPSDKGSLGADTNLQAAMRMNLRVASSHRNSSGRPGGCWERRAASLPAKAATGAMFLSGGCGPGSPAYQGWHAGTVIRGNSRGPHASRPDLQPGKPAYKANAEVAGDGFCSGGVGGERTSVDRRDNTTRREQRLPTSAALVGARERPTLVPKG